MTTYSDIKRYKLEITVCSPLHIGAAKDFDPTNYVIVRERPPYVRCEECDNKNPTDKIGEDALCLECGSDLNISPEELAGQGYLYTFTPKELSAAVGRQKLLAAAKTENFLQLQKFFKDNDAKIAAKARKRAWVAKDVLRKYENKFGNQEVRKNEINCFIIEKNISTAADNMPYIPGSSLKGAIRTALLSAAQQQKKLSGRKSAEIEKLLAEYTSPFDDPFGCLKIGDSRPQKEFMSHICTARNVKRRFNKTDNSLPVYAEIISAGTVFCCDLTVTDEREREAVCFTAESLRKACNDFYLPLLEEQKKVLTANYDIPASFFDKVKKTAAAPDTFILCLGKHGSAEHVTIEGLRKISIRLKRNKSDKGKENPGYRIEDHSTTYWLAEDTEGSLPFGWCVVRYERI